jgi:hypothetical protein
MGKKVLEIKNTVDGHQQKISESRQITFASSDS